VFDVKAGDTIKESVDILKLASIASTTYLQFYYKYLADSGLAQRM
jgi:hypothetical protein